MLWKVAGDEVRSARALARSRGGARRRVGRGGSLPWEGVRGLCSPGGQALAQGGHGMGEAPGEHVFVDGNNVMGARADGWWRDRRGAARRLTGEIGAVARACGGAWTVVFDGRAPAHAAPTSADLEVVYAGHGRRDGADDRIVALLAELGSGAGALVYTSDVRLRERVSRLGARVAGARVLLARCAAAGDRDTREGSTGTFSGE